ncbi:MAG TPA: ankyrin repeat domain-containing protein [Alphaproteobacteria bacterium]|nr:ankyrin repeat domain-containing protein [Alphaproteobacteria bacterium]
MSDKDKDADVKERAQSGKTVAETKPAAEGFGELLIRAVEHGEAEKVRSLIDEGVDVNFRDEANGATALHYAAALSAQFCLLELIRSGQCDYLVRDKQGLYPSEVAFEIADNLRIGSILAEKEADQAHRTGVQAWPKPDQ